MIRCKLNRKGCNLYSRLRLVDHEPAIMYLHKLSPEKENEITAFGS
jgi:hypothetical protein